MAGQNTAPGVAADDERAGGAGTGFPVDVDLLLKLGSSRSLHPPIENADGSVTHVFGNDQHHVSVPALNPVLPAFVTAAEVLVEPASFIDYIILFKSETAICKASLGSNEIVAVLDYHGRARTGDASAAVPNRMAHTVTLECPFDRDYAKWRRVFAGEKFDQRQLAELIEDMIHTISQPAAADLLEAVADLKIDRSVKLKSFRDDRTGNVKFHYEETDDPASQGDVLLPTEIVIVTPIFQGGPATQLTAKLRHRLDKGAVVFSLAVPGLDNLERIAFRSIGEKVRSETNTPVFYTA